MSIRSVALGAVLALAVGLTPGTAFAQDKSVPGPIKGDSSGVYRIWGSDRVSTAIFASRDLYPSANKKKPEGKPKHQASHVIVAGADKPADSATAVSLAVQTAAPILLTYANSTVPNSGLLHPYTRNEIERVLKRGGMVTIIGGVDSVSLQVEDQIKKLTNDKNEPYNFVVRRLAGSNRELTSQAVSGQTAERNQTNSMLTNPLKTLDTYNVVTASFNPSKVYAVDGSDANWKAALVAGNIAARNNGMVVLGPQGVQWARENLSGFRLVRVGYWHPELWPADVVPDEDYGNLDANLMALSVDLAGTNKVAFATDLKFPDALVGAAHAAQRDRALLLVAGTQDRPTPELLNAVKPYTSPTKKKDDYFYGGNVAIKPSLASSLADAK